jgi:tetratricopeptide (TPR) repeat protein
MWLLLWILHLPLSGLTHVSVAAEPISGASAEASTPSDAATLWRMGREHFGQGEYSSATFLFERLIQRHPAYSDSLDAQYLLGVSFLRLGEPEKAIGPFRHYVEAKGEARDGLRGRLTLIEAYLGAGRFQEAMLTTLDIRNRKDSPHVSPDLYYKALLFRAISLFRLNQFEPARAALKDFFSETPQTDQWSPDRSRAYFTQLEMQLQECKKFPGKDPKREAETLSLLQKRAICLKENLLLFRKILNEIPSEWTQKARELLIFSFSEYRNVTLSPPPGTGKRTPLQEKRYQAELVDFLYRDFQEQMHSVLAILGSWEENEDQSQLDELRRLKTSLEEMTQLSISR